MRYMLEQNRCYILWGNLSLPDVQDHQNILAVQQCLLLRLVEKLEGFRYSKSFECLGI